VIDEYGANGGMTFAGETEVLGENLPSVTLSTTNHTWKDPGAIPGLRGERPATNRLSHGTALVFSLSTLNTKLNQLSFDRIGFQYGSVSGGKGRSCI
jgi:hypothetical protein